MNFHKIIRILEQPARADKSAVGAVNRPLRAVWYNRRPRFIVGTADLSASRAHDHMKLVKSIIGAGRDTSANTDGRSILFICIIGARCDTLAPTAGRSILFICIISYRSLHCTFRLLFVGTGYILSNCLKFSLYFHATVRTCMLQ